MKKINVNRVREGLHVLVVGDVMLDRYYAGESQRISPEAPVPVLKLQKKELRAGGAANVALILANLGAKVTLIGLVGEDKASKQLNTLLEEAGVRVEFVFDKTAVTTVKTRCVVGAQQLLRVDEENEFSSAAKQAVVERVCRELTKHEACVCSDYAKGTLEHIQIIIRRAKAVKVPVFIDPKRVSFAEYAGAFLIKPNLLEFSRAFSVNTPVRQSQLELCARSFLKQNQVDAVLVTQGSQGMTLVTQEAAQHFSCEAMDIKDVTGAGDTVLAVLVWSVLQGKPLVASTNIANIAAGISVSKTKTQLVQPWELQAALNQYEQVGAWSEAQVADLGENMAKQGKTLVMTNGCFDVLHPGHIGYLNAAKQEGDFLLVAVNSDNSVRKLKGAHRPAVSARDRCAVLMGLSAVDAVVVFDELTPELLIQWVKPRVLVKGKDYHDIHKVAGAKAVLSWGGGGEIFGARKGMG